MQDPQIAALQKQVSDLQGKVNQLMRGDRYLFQRDLDIFDKNIVLHSTLGTKIGTVNTQKLGFFGATPIAGNSAILNIPFPVTAADLYNALNSLGLVYHT